jgi:hypothetical protein
MGNPRLCNRTTAEALTKSLPEQGAPHDSSASCSIFTGEAQLRSRQAPYTRGARLHLTEQKFAALQKDNCHQNRHHKRGRPMAGLNTSSTLMKIQLTGARIVLEQEQEQAPSKTYYKPGGLRQTMSDRKQSLRPLPCTRTTVLKNRHHKRGGHHPYSSPMSRQLRQTTTIPKDCNFGSTTAIERGTTKGNPIRI